LRKFEHRIRRLEFVAVVVVGLIVLIAYIISRVRGS